MSHDTIPSPNPSGLCMCGCGRTVTLATRTYPERGLVKGQPVHYAKGHRSGERCRPVPREWLPRVLVRLPFDERYLRNGETGCWEWQGPRGGGGYGKLRVNNRYVSAHRWAYERVNGPVPTGMTLDHLCRNRLCCNPEHLEVVTNAVNVRRGKATKLDAATVAQMKWLMIREGPPTDKQLAAAFSVTPGTIRAIRIGYTWREVAPAEPTEPLRSMARIDHRGGR